MSSKDIIVLVALFLATVITPALAEDKCVCLMRSEFTDAASCKNNHGSWFCVHENLPKWQAWVHERAEEIEQKNTEARVNYCAASKLKIKSALSEVADHWPTCEAVIPARQATRLLDNYFADGCSTVNADFDVISQLSRDLDLLIEYFKGCK